MAIVNDATLNALRTTIRGEFSTALKNAQAESMYGKLATSIHSGSSSNTYGWLGKFPQMKKWVGDRVLKSMKESSYQIPNEKYEATLEVERTDIEDDNLGQYRTLAQAQGQECIDFKDRAVAKLLKDGFSALCYDGQNFFDDSHPVYANVDGTGSSSTQSNIVGTGSGSPWFLMALNRPLKPLIVQDRTAFELESITNTQNDHVFMKDKYLYGIRWRGAFGYGLWQLAVGSKDTLNKDNFEKAFKQMQSFKMDGGDPMGIRATALVVSPDNESAAEQILKMQTISGVGTNPNYNKVELIVNPWLA